MSYHRLSTKPLNVTLNALMKRAAHVGLGVGAFTPILALANPTGGNVVAGQATIATPNANGLVINQASQSAIINWQQFSIGKGQYVQFLQPSSSSVVLNRVVGGNATSILGSLNANGQVFLVNPNGIFFGKGSSLDVQGIVASTLDIANSNFLTGNYVFQKGTGAGNASVVNQGNINAHKAGYVVLAGDYSENDGIIQARSGHVVLAAGSRTTLTLSGNSLVNFAVNSATLAQLAGAKNTGSLIADGGTVVMTADVANALKATVVNNTGLIEAHAISKNNGAIYLTATGGNIVNAGTLDANAGAANQAGGTIQLKGDARTNLTSTSKITATGNGADGGHLEVSGRTINVRGSAKLGKGGNMLLDPNSIELVAGSGANDSSGAGKGTGTGANADVGVTFIQTQLNAGANVAISAHNRIFHAGSVTSITAATGAGNLKFKVGSSGGVQLGGVGINIKGGLTASMGYGSFGILQAKSITLDAVESNGFVHLQDATSVGGVVSKYSAKATAGNVTITAAHIEASGEGGLLAIDAHGGSVNLTGNVNIAGTSSVYQGPVTLLGKSVSVDGNIKANGNVNITASAGALNIGNVITTGAGDNVTLAATGGNLSAGQIEAGNALTVTDTTGNTKLGDIAAYGGALTVTDTTGNMTLGIVSGAHAVTLSNGAHVLSFSHSAGSGNPTVRAGGTLNIKAATIQTAGTNLELKESDGGIMTVRGAFSLPNKNLTLEDNEGTIDLNRSIVAGRAVTIDANKLAFIGAGPNFSISAGYGNLTLDAGIGSAGVGAVKYNVNLKDNGYGIFIEKSIFTGATAGALAANVTATETNHFTSGLSGVLVGNHSGGAVTVQAAGSVILKGWNVGVGHVINSSAGTFGAITVKAAQNLNFTASGTGSHGGNVGIKAQNVSANNGTKNSSILVQAGGALKFVGKQVDIRAGSVHAFMSGSHANGSASASANVTVKAGGNVTIIGGTSGNGRVSIDGGNAIASGSARGSHHHKTNANANVSITSTKGNIAISGHRVEVSAGYGAVAEAFASGEAGTMTANANGNATLTAAGTISLTTGTNGSSFVRLAGGNRVGHNGYGEARGFNEQATAAAHDDVSLTAAGIVLTGARVDVSAGYGAGRQSTSPNAHVNVARASNGTNAIATYTATANVNLTAGATGIAITGIAITGSGEGGSVHIHGGSSTMLHQASASADGTKSKATATASGRVNIVDAGAFSALTNGHVDIQGGNSVAAHAFVEGNEGGSAAMTGDGGVSISATTITIGSAGGHSAGVNIGGGGRAASHGRAEAAGSYGGATLTGLSSVSMTATGALKIAAGSNIFINVGSQGGNQASASANDHAKAAVKAGANVSIQGASVKIASLNGVVEVSAGYGAARGAQAHASYGSAAVTAAEGISITATAGNMVLSGKGFVGVRGGESAAAGFGTHHSFSNSTHGFGSHGSTEHIHHSVNGFSYASATAKGTGASALVNGAAGVSLTAKKGTLTISQTQTSGGSLRMGAGGGAAFAAYASASNGATATVSGTGALSIITGNLTVTGHRVAVFGGGDGGRGVISHDSHRVQGSHSSGEGLHPFSSGTATTPITQANTAKGAGAIAKVIGDGSVTIKSGTVSLTANGASLEVSAGYGGGSSGHLKASNGGLASISAKTGVAITATTAFTAVDNGNFLAFRGAGDSAARAVVNAQGSGAKALMNVNAAVTLSAPTVTMTGANEVEIHGGGAAGSRASITAGEGGSAKAITDSSVSIKGATVSLTATASQLDISAGYGGGSHAKVAATSGQASFSAKTGVGITATIAFTATDGGSDLRITAAGDAGRSASVNANGPGAKALMNVDDQVTITAPTVTLNGANDIFIQGASEDARHAIVKAAGGGSAALTANGGANITVATAFAANLTGTHADGSIGILGGRDGGSGALASASGSGAKATLANNSDVNITATAAGGTITIQTGAHKGADISINAGDQTAHGMSAKALQGTVTATVSGNVNLTAPGVISLKANKGNIGLNSSNEGGVASHAFAGAGAGAKTTVSISDNINLTAAAIGLKAGTFLTGSHSSNVNGGNIFIKDGLHNLARLATASAGNGGSVALTANSQVNIKATAGNLTINAGGSFDISKGCCSNIHVGSSALAAAGGGNAKAALTINDGVLLQATGAVTLTAGHNLSITVASGIGATSSSVPGGAGASAGFKGQATFIRNGAINIVAGGTFTAKAGTDLNFGAGTGGGLDFAKANHAGGQATFQSDGSLNITATAVALSGGESVNLFAGAVGGWGGNANASNGATAAFTTNRSVNVTAKNSITMTLTGKTSGGNIEVEGGSAVGLGAEAHASHNGGKATMSNIADLNLKVTGATGTITLNAGSHTGADVSIRARSVADAFGVGLSFFPAAAVAGKGGSASLLDTGNVNLSAKGAVTVNAGVGGNLTIVAGGRTALSAGVNASSGGKATLTAQAGTNIGGGTVTLTAGDNITITGASKVAENAGVHAERGGIANFMAQTGTTIVSKGALTATAGSNLTIAGNGTSLGGHAAQSASVSAQSGNALANLTVTDGVRLTAATVALKATKGSLSISAGSNAGNSANVHAQTHKDKATLNVDDGIAITATGAISLTAGKDLDINGGNNAGASASVTAGSFAAASMNATAGVSIKAGAAFTAKAANGNMSVAAGNDAGSSVFASASGHGAATKFSANGGINITATAISLTAASVPGTSPGEGSLTIRAGNFVGLGAEISASKSGNAAYSALSAVNLSATGAITLNAKAGSLTIRAGSEGFQQGGLLGVASQALHASGSAGGVAKVAADSSINITAGGAIGLNAKGNIQVSGGYGEFAIVNAIGGSASAALNGGVNLKAGSTLTATAGGALTLHGGSEAGIAAQQLFQFPTSLGTPPPGVVNGTVNTGVNLAAGGAVTLTAGGDVTVAAGNGETLAVGKIRSFPPSPSSSGVTFLGANHHSWGGGSANLSANLGVAVTAGTALTVTAGAAGAGSLQVLGLGKNPGASAGFQNVVSVRGGSSHAVANLTLNGNATLTAGTDVFINAAGNASIAGGALFNIRVDGTSFGTPAHTEGNITLTGSANATVHAGLDVMLNNIKGSLTLAGANAGPSAQEMLVDAHANSGAANVTGHADATISAVRDVVTVTKMGGGLNLIAGSLVAAVAVGSASNQHATATASAAIKAGRNVTISATGGLNLLGGNFDRASVGSASHLSDAINSAAMTARADITAGGKVKIAVGGNAFIAGGDSLLGKVSYLFDGFVVGNATADAGVGIQGGAVNLTVGGDLKARGGSGAKGSIFAITSNASMNAKANAGVNIAATVGGLVITANGASASFLGGSGVTGKTEVILGGGNSANATAHSDLNLSAAGGMLLTIKGKLTVAGGADADQFGTDIGGAPAGRLSAGSLPVANTNTNVTATGAVNFTAGTTLTVAQAGGDLSIIAGSRGASFASVNAVGPNAKTSLNVDTGVHIKAGGALAFTGAHNVNIVAGRFADSSATPFLFSSGAGAHATAVVDNSVKLSGTSVHIAHTGTFTSNSSSGFSSGGLIIRGGFSTAALAAPHTLGVRTLSMRPMTEMLHVAPMATQSSFGGAKTLSGMPVTDISDSTSVQPTVVDTANGLSVDITAQTLATLQGTSLVTHIVTLVGSDAADLVASSSQTAGPTLFTPAISSGDYSSSFSGACVALVVSRSGQSRCSLTGGK